MAHGIKVRMPFLDWRLVALVVALPEETCMPRIFNAGIDPDREAEDGSIPNAGLAESARFRNGLQCD
jgi:hypothetical protein